MKLPEKQILCMKWLHYCQNGEDCFFLFLNKSIKIHKKKDLIGFNRFIKFN